MKHNDANQIKAAILITLAILAVIGYLTFNVNPKYVEFAMRLPVSYTHLPMISKPSASQAINSRRSSRTRRSSSTRKTRHKEDSD